MSLRLRHHTKLVNGKRDERGDSRRAYAAQFSGTDSAGLNWQGSLGAHTEDAIVVLRYDRRHSLPILDLYLRQLRRNIEAVGFFHAGEAAVHGLYEVLKMIRRLSSSVLFRHNEQLVVCALIGTVISLRECRKLDQFQPIRIRHYEITNCPQRN